MRARSAPEAAAAERWPERYGVCGVGVSAVDLQRAGDAVEAAVARREPHYVVVASIHGVVVAQDDPDFAAIVESAGLVVPDGMPLVWAARRRGLHHVEQVTGMELVLEVSRRLAARGGAAFYYGGEPGVADDLAAQLGRRFPGLRNAGTYCPPFRPLSPAEADAVAAQIDASGADVVWVGISTPQQEAWMAAMRPRLAVPCLAGVGGAFDFVTGRVHLPPPPVRRLGLGWLYRAAQRPRYLRRYAQIIPAFAYHVLRHELRGGARR